MKLCHLATVALFGASLVLGSKLHGDAERKRIVHTVNNHPEASWKAELHPRFAGQPIHEMSRQLGVLHLNPAEDSRIPLLTHTDFDALSLPEKFDARLQWQECHTIGEIRDQSNCGSCWAHAAVEAGSDRICIQTNGTMKARLSVEDLLTCGWNLGCSGGDPGLAWLYMSTVGVVTGGDYGDFSWCNSYKVAPCTNNPSPSCHGEVATPKCVRSCDANSTYNTPFEKDLHVFNSTYRLNTSDLASVQREILTNGPVEAAFSVYTDFSLYKSGVYHHVTGSFAGLHAIKILGWGVDQATQVPYWLAANSWGTGWGEKGFFRIRRGSNECDIETYMTAGKYRDMK